MTYKTFILGTALVAVAAGSAFAQSTSQSRPPGEPARTQTTDQNRTASGDQAFVSKMAGVNMAEVELGMMAKDKASGKDVKAFAQRMIDDHRKANEELKTVADRKHLTWSTALPPDARALKDKLSKLSGTGFDHAYVDAMVMGHGEALMEARSEAQSGSDPEVKAWAMKASSTIQAHLTHAQDLQKEQSKRATH